MHMTRNSSQQKVDQLVEHLFRRQAGQIVSTLTRFFGIEHLDLIEDVVQETLLKALQQWVFRGVPNNPAGWISQSAKHHALDVLRRESTFRSKEKQIAEQIEQEFSASSQASHIYLKHEFNDDQLRMMFTCCHPALSRETRVALTLKTLCGFSVAEIARAFLSQDVTIAQRIVRAKRKLLKDKLPFEVPAAAESFARLDSVLDVLYLLFNEGYSAHHGENLVRDDLCEEAIRLTAILVEHSVGDQPRTHALLALMLLQASRLPARLDSDGNLLRLQEQDRTLWDRRLIQLGMTHLENAAAGDVLSEYHLQAGIAACHAVADSYVSTDWRKILNYYDELIELIHSPVVALNRAVALSLVDGPEAGLKALDKLHSLPPLKSYYLLPACYAEFYRQLGQPENAIVHYENALKLVGTEPERRFLLQKLSDLQVNDALAAPR